MAKYVCSECGGEVQGDAVTVADCKAHPLAIIVPAVLSVEEQIIARKVEAADLTGADGLEISPIAAVDGGPEVEVTSRERAEFWSVYKHLEVGGVQCLEDFGTEAAARTYAAGLLAKAKRLGLAMPFELVEGAMP